MRDSLPEAVWEHYEKYRRILHVHALPAKSYRQQHGTLKVLNRAILEHRVVQIEYQSLRQPASHRRLIEPYGVVFFQGSLYIIAAVADDEPPKQPRHFKLDRFRKATALDRWFKPPADFNLQQHLGQSLGIFAGGRARNFRVRISAYAAPWVIEDPWHPQQQIERRRDGGITLTVPAVHELEIIPRVLALGAEAELLSPASCRRQIAETIREMAARYDE